MSGAVKAIYAGIRALGIGEEEDQRDLYERITGKRSLRQMSANEQEAVVKELRRLGFRPAGARRQLDGPYAKKLQALWIAGWNLGLVRNRDDAALIAFVKRQTGIEHTRWLRDPAAAEKAVEALKGWLARDGGVVWTVPQGHDWLKDHGAKIAWAQWRKLHPAATLRERAAFSAKVAVALRLRIPEARLDALTSADWRAVSNALGAVLRGGGDR